MLTRVQTAETVYLGSRTTMRTGTVHCVIPCKKKSGNFCDGQLCRGSFSKRTLLGLWLPGWITFESGFAQAFNDKARLYTVHVSQLGVWLSVVLISVELNSALCESAWSWTQWCVSQRGIGLSTVLVSAELDSALCLSARSWTQRCIIQHGDRLSTVFVSEELNSRQSYSAWSWT